MPALDLNLNANFSSSTPGELGSSGPSSTFPYESVGPVDYSNLNFVKTTQVDYYYDTVGTSTTQYLISTVTQTYDPIEAILAVGLLMIAFLSALSYGIYKIRKMGK